MRKHLPNALLVLLALSAWPAPAQTVESFPAQQKWLEPPVDLSRSLKPEDLERLSPTFTRQILHSADGTFLLVTNDYGSGVELRDAYVYVWRHPVWQLVTYRRTNSAELTGRITGDRLVIVGKSGKVAMSIPLGTVNPAFDGSEP